MNAFGGGGESRVIDFGNGLKATKCIVPFKDTLSLMLYMMVR